MDDPKISSSIFMSGVGGRIASRSPKECAKRLKIMILVIIVPIIITLTIIMIKLMTATLREDCPCCEVDLAFCVEGDLAIALRGILLLR